MRIVLVDPSRVVQRALGQLIEEDGHEVVAFADGLKALSGIAQDDQVRALITSTQPLNISGIELCAAASKLSGSRRALHVVLMSSTDDLHMVVAALDNGADDFIQKPPIPDELRARLRLADRVTSMKQQLIRYATTDGLTGLLNRRAFFESAAEMCRAAHAGSALSAIMFDIDHFKRINDTYGHEMGDRVLSAVGAEITGAGQVAGRLGGEEFCVLIYGDALEALNGAGELQQSIRALRFDHNGQVFINTCSFGIAEWETGDTIDRLLRRADLAMYQAKQSGRDKIVMADTFALTPRHDEWRGAVRAGRRHT
jgi:two-component system, cell cycle response regulator